MFLMLCDMEINLHVTQQDMFKDQSFWRNISKLKFLVLSKYKVVQILPIEIISNILNFILDHPIKR